MPVQSHLCLRRRFVLVLVFCGMFITLAEISSPVLYRKRVALHILFSFIFRHSSSSLALSVPLREICQTHRRTQNGAERKKLEILIVKEINFSIIPLKFRNEENVNKKSRILIVACRVEDLSFSSLSRTESEQNIVISFPVM